MSTSAPTPSEPLLVVILGPTGSGKSALAIALAQQFAGEVVSCDSVAVYRHFEIGTAKPTLQQRTLVPHHLLDVAEPGQPFTAGGYARQARAAIAKIAGRQRLPIVVGGTGLYLRALLEGLFPGPQRSEQLRERLRERAQERGSPYLHKLLLRLDPAAGGAVCAPQPAGLPDVRARANRGNKISARAIRRSEERHTARFARLQAGNTIFARRTYARAGAGGDAARTS